MSIKTSCKNIFFPIVHYYTVFIKTKAHVTQYCGVNIDNLFLAKFLFPLKRQQGPILENTFDNYVTRLHNLAFLRSIVMDILHLG